MSRALLSLLIVVLGGGCVPSFDRCRIPGTAGCASEDASVGPDAGSGCPASPAAAALFESTFDDPGTLGQLTLFGDPAADWAIEAGELVQRQPRSEGAAALLTDITAADVWVSARMRQLASLSGGAAELAVRGSASDSYHCNWEPTTGQFEIQRDTSRSALVATQIALASLPDYEPSDPVTMDLEVVGSRVTCCLREIPGASLTVFDDSLPGGSPGARTFQLAAAYDSLEVRPAR